MYINDNNRNKSNMDNNNNINYNNINYSNNNIMNNNKNKNNYNYINRSIDINQFNKKNDIFMNNDKNYEMYINDNRNKSNINYNNINYSNNDDNNNINYSNNDDNNNNDDDNNNDDIENEITENINFYDVDRKMNNTFDYNIRSRDRKIVIGEKGGINTILLEDEIEELIKIGEYCGDICTIYDYGVEDVENYLNKERVLEYLDELKDYENKQKLLTKRGKEKNEENINLINKYIELVEKYLVRKIEIRMHGDNMLIKGKQEIVKECNEVKNEPSIIELEKEVLRYLLYKFGLNNINWDKIIKGYEKNQDVMDMTFIKNFIKPEENDTYDMFEKEYKNVFIPFVVKAYEWYVDSIELTQEQEEELKNIINFYKENSFDLYEVIKSYSKDNIKIGDIKTVINTLEENKKYELKKQDDIEDYYATNLHKCFVVLKKVFLPKILKRLRKNKNEEIELENKIKKFNKINKHYDYDNDSYIIYEYIFKSNCQIGDVKDFEKEGLGKIGEVQVMINNFTDEYIKEKFDKNQENINKNQENIGKYLSGTKNFIKELKEILIPNILDGLEKEGPLTELEHKELNNILKRNNVSYLAVKRGTFNEISSIINKMEDYNERNIFELVYRENAKEINMDKFIEELSNLHTKVKERLDSEEAN